MTVNLPKEKMNYLHHNITFVVGGVQIQRV